MPIEIKNTEEFHTLINQKDRVVAVDFWAPWCGPCQTFGPTLDTVAETLGEQATIAKVNVDEHRGIAQHYGIRSIPTVLYFRQGQEIDRSGMESAENIISRLQSLALQQA